MHGLGYKASPGYVAPIADSSFILFLVGEWGKFRVAYLITHAEAFAKRVSKTKCSIIQGKHVRLNVKIGHV